MAENNFEDQASYILGVVSIILVFITTFGLGGIVTGILGLVLTRKAKTPLGLKAKKLSLIGLILGIIVFVGLMILGTVAFINNPSLMQGGGLLPAS